MLHQRISKLQSQRQSLTQQYISLTYDLIKLNQKKHGWNAVGRNILIAIIAVFLFPFFLTVSTCYLIINEFMPWVRFKSSHITMVRSSERGHVGFPWIGETIGFLADRFGHVFHTYLNLTHDWYRAAKSTICVQRSCDVQIKLRKTDLKLEQFQGRLSSHLPIAREVSNMLLDLYLNDCSLLSEWEEEINETITTSLEKLVYEPHAFDLDSKLKELVCDILANIFFSSAGLSPQLLRILLQYELEIQQKDATVNFATSSSKDLVLLISLGLKEEKRKLSTNQALSLHSNRQAQSRPQFVLTALYEDTKDCIQEINANTIPNEITKDRKQHQVKDGEIVECMLVFLTDCVYFPLVESLHHLCITVLQSGDQDWMSLINQRYHKYQASFQHLGILSEKKVKKYSWVNSLRLPEGRGGRRDTSNQKHEHCKQQEIPSNLMQNVRAVGEALKNPLSSLFQAAFTGPDEAVVMDSDEDENVNDYGPFSDEDDKDETIDWFELEQKRNNHKQQQRQQNNKSGATHLQPEDFDSNFDESSDASSVATEDIHHDFYGNQSARSASKSPQHDKLRAFSEKEYFKEIKHDPRLHANLLSYVGVIHEVEEFAVFSAVGPSVLETFKRLQLSEGQQQRGQPLGRVHSTHKVSPGEQLIVVADESSSMVTCHSMYFLQLVACNFLHKLLSSYSLKVRPADNVRSTTAIMVEKVTAKHCIDLFIPDKLSSKDFQPKYGRENSTSCEKEKKLIDLSSYFNLTKQPLEDNGDLHLNEDTRYFSDGL